MASRKGWPCQGWSLPENPGSLLGWGGWQQLAGCWMRFQSCLPHRHWGKIHKGHRRGKMPMRKTNGLFSFLLGFSETSTFTSHLFSTLFSPSSVFQSLLSQLDCCVDRTQWNAHDCLGSLPPTRGHWGLSTVAPDKTGFGSLCPGTASLLKTSAVGVEPAAGLGFRGK